MQRHDGLFGQQYMVYSVKDTESRAFFIFSLANTFMGNLLILTQESNGRYGMALEEVI